MSEKDNARPIGNEVWLAPIGIFAAGFGAGAFRQLPPWAAASFVLGGLVVLFGLIAYTGRRSVSRPTPEKAPEKTPEQVGAEVYALALQPTVIEVTLTRDGKDIIADIARRQKVPIGMIPVLALREYVQEHGRRLE
jgi:hypothetical protein